MMDWNGNGHMTTWAWLWMGMWGVLVIAGIVALVLWAGRTRDSRRDRGGAGAAPEATDGRHATGELEGEEHDHRREQL
jgi:uncharacterized membrane protein